jgi:DNA recombination protein RmuC
MEIIIGIIAASFGVAIALFMTSRSSKSNRESNEQLMSGLMGQAMVELREAARIEREEARKGALDAASEQLSRKEEVINAGMNAVKDAVSQQIDDLEKVIEALHSSTSTNYGGINTSVGDLAKQTGKLIEVLGNNGSRGQFGERIAEDILIKAGFIEGISYKKEDRESVEGGRPDFSFEVPPDQMLYLDCKFPLDAYKRYYEATTDGEKKLQLDSFKTAVNKKIKDLQKRDYVEKSRRAAIDYVLLFIPNESISNFIQEKFPDIVDQALDNKVVLCSPTNLYAFLAIVRQANQTFQTQKATGEILGLLAGFNSEWKKYVAAVGDVRSNFDKLTESMDLVVKGARFNKLAVAVRRMEELRSKKGIEPIEIDESEETSGELDEE